MAFSIVVASEHSETVQDNYQVSSGGLEGRKRREGPGSPNPGARGGGRESLNWSREPQPRWKRRGGSRDPQPVEGAPTQGGEERRVQNSFS